MASQGLAAAALAFKYQLVHFVWIMCVFVSVSFSGWRFYETARNPTESSDLSGAMPIAEGFIRVGIAWVCVMTAYFYCIMFPEKSDISKRYKKMEREKKIERRGGEGKKEE